MKNGFLCLLCCLPAFLVAEEEAPSPLIREAVALFAPSKGGSVRGQITLTQVAGAISMTGSLFGFEPGEYQLTLSKTALCKAEGELQEILGDEEEKEATFSVIVNEEGSTSFAFLIDGLTLNGPLSIVGYYIVMERQDAPVEIEDVEGSSPRRGCAAITRLEPDPQ